MKAIGVNVGTCGTRTVRLRPMLIFDESHSKLYLVALPFIRLVLTICPQSPSSSARSARSWRRSREDLTIERA